MYPILKGHIDSVKRVILSVCTKNDAMHKLHQLKVRVELMLTQLGHIQPTVALSELSTFHDENGKEYQDQVWNLLF